MPALRAADRPGIRLLRDPVQLVAFGFGAGLSPWAPGTLATACSLPLAWLVMGWPLAWGAALVGSLILCGIPICGIATRRLGVHDHPGIVLDEIAAMLLLALTLPKNVVWLAGAFVLFRLFDILKPWPIREMDHRLGGGVGIMLDDLMAAVYAMACLQGIRYLLAIA